MLPCEVFKNLFTISFMGLFIIQKKTMICMILDDCRDFSESKSFKIMVIMAKKCAF